MVWIYYVIIKYYEFLNNINTYSIVIIIIWIIFKIPILTLILLVWDERINEFKFSVQKQIIFHFCIIKINIIVIIMIRILLVPVMN